MRDIQRSGQAAGEVIQQVSETVFPMYKAFIEPDLNNAEIKVTNNFNPFAGFKEPIQILKTDDTCSVDKAYDVLKDMYPSDEISRVCHLCLEYGTPELMLHSSHNQPLRVLSICRRMRLKYTTSSCSHRVKTFKLANHGCVCATKKVDTA